MKKRGCLTIAALLLIAMVFYIWFETSPTVRDFRYMYGYQSEYDLILAFEASLRRHSPVLYEITDPSLHARIDEWRRKYRHEPQRCYGEPYTTLIGPGKKEGSRVLLFSCRGYHIRIDDIMIKDMKIVDYLSFVQ